MRRWKLGFAQWNMNKGVEVLKKMNEFGFKKVEQDEGWWGCRKDECNGDVLGFKKLNKMKFHRRG